MRIAWSRPALDDLRAIDDWLTRETRPEIAVRTLTAIQARALFLERFPHGGRPLHDGHRILRTFGTPYLIRYRIRESSSDDFDCLPRGNVVLA